jgi:transcriptional regulator with XRE-family HTH domain
LGLTQQEFADRYRIPIGTLRDWEQGRTEPDQAARAYLNVIARDPVEAARRHHNAKQDGMNGQQATFQLVQLVYPKAASSLEGAVIEIHQRPHGGFYYRVFHSAGHVVEYDENQLAPNTNEHRF